MSPDDAFLASIAAEPEDDTVRLIYADWLEDQGDLRAEYVRLECQLAHTARTSVDYTRIQIQLRNLAARLDAAWVDKLRRPIVENCRPQFQYRCPKQWIQLQETEDPTVRHCDTCGQSVHYCNGIEEARELVRLEVCVALDSRVERSPGDLDPFDDDLMSLGLLAPESDWDLALEDDLDFDTYFPEPDVFEVAPPRPTFVRKASATLRRFFSRLGFNRRLRTFLTEAFPGRQVRLIGGGLEGEIGMLISIHEDVLRATVSFYQGTFQTTLDIEDLELCDYDPSQTIPGSIW